MSPLPNVAALLANATPGPWGTRARAGTGRFGYWEDAQLAGSAPALAAALIEAADALRNISDASEASSPLEFKKAGRAALDRLVAFDASLKETA